MKEAFKKEKKVEEILMKDVVKVKRDTPLQEIVSELGQQTDSTIPAVVVDDEDRLLGIVGRGAVWAALAGQGGDNE